MPVGGRKQKGIARGTDPKFDSIASEIKICDIADRMVLHGGHVYGSG